MGTGDPKEPGRNVIALDSTVEGGTPESGEPPAPASPLKPGDRLDRFVIQELLGRGGMGDVLAAFDPSLDRKVAIKVLHRDEGDPSRKDRLLREARAMARLAHANVVTVHEVGLLGGRLYLALEYVDGQNLAGWLREAPRDWRAIVDVFVQAGRGLAAAHEAGLVHRDFKPENVMVHRSGRARVTDFGLVSGTGLAADSAPTPGDDHGTDSSPSWPSLTRSGALLGTPAYMSPEQHRREPVDARSDQFAFCVALYRALYGVPPFAGDRYAELAANVMAGRLRPPPASATAPARVRDAVLRGLRTDPAERFPSMNALVDALATEPAHRRWWPWLVAGAAVVVAGGAVAGALLLRANGAGAASTGAICADASAELAGAWDEARLAQVRAAMLADPRPHAAAVLSRVEAALDSYARDWIVMRGESCAATFVRQEQSGDLFDLRAACLERRRSRLAALTDLLGRGPDAVALDRAIDAAESLPPIADCADAESLRAAMRAPEDPMLRERVAALFARVDETQALESAGRYKEGLEQLHALMPQIEATRHLPLLAAALDAEQALATGFGDRQAASAALDRAQLVAAQAGDDRLAAEVAIGRLYVQVHLLSQGAKADELVRAAEAAVMRAGNDEELQVRLAAHRGLAELTREHYDEAVASLQRAATLGEKVYGAEARSQGMVLANLALALDSAGKYPEARIAYERALAIQERVFGPDHPVVGNTLQNVGINLRYLGELDKAIAVSQRALKIVEASSAPDSADVAVAAEALGLVYFMANRHAEARPYMERALAIREKVLGAKDPIVAKGLHNLALLMTDIGDYAAAQRLLERSIAIKIANDGPEHAGLASAEYALGDLLQRQDHCAQAIAHFQRSLAIADKTLPKDHPNLAYPLQGLGVCEHRLGRPVRAIAPMERGLRLLQNAGASPVEIGWLQFELGRALWDAGRDRGRAVALAREARASYGAGSGDQSKPMAEIDAWLAKHAR